MKQRALAIDYTDEEVVEYGETIDELVEECRKLKAHTAARN